MQKSNSDYVATNLLTPGKLKPGQSFPASGNIGIPMTNDYLFRALLQKNNHVLKGLIGALLHMGR